MSSNGLPNSVMCVCVFYSKLRYLELNFLCVAFVGFQRLSITRGNCSVDSLVFPLSGCLAICSQILIYDSNPHIDTVFWSFTRLLYWENKSL